MYENREGRNQGKLSMKYSEKMEKGKHSHSGVLDLSSNIESLIYSLFLSFSLFPYPPIYLPLHLFFPFLSHSLFSFSLKACACVGFVGLGSHLDPIIVLFQLLIKGNCY